MAEIIIEIEAGPDGMVFWYQSGDIIPANSGYKPKDVVELSEIQKAQQHNQELA
ncbi:hypothetical protein [Neisseria sp. S1]|uniref:hypothetical protein n=1 Tax=Neisseria sp. S1 TaxID=3318354 RepID=UPI003A8BA020